jgi:hypothetical protein
MVATRPKLIETQYVDGLRVVGAPRAAVQSAPPLAPANAFAPPAAEQRAALSVCKVSLTKQLSVTNCTLGATFGCNSDGSTMWVGGYHGSSKGCRGEFNCDGVAGVKCDPATPDGGNPNHTCTCLHVAPTPAPAPLDGTLTLQNSPFWTLTPSYSQNIEVRDLRILAPMDR